MAERRICDCGCGLEIDEFDAGQMPTVFRSPGGVDLKIEVLPNHRGVRPMIRVGCLRKLLAGAELAYPKLALVDATSEEPGIVQLPTSKRAEGKS